MSFLAPWTALTAAAVAVPALLTLYLLKLRRRIVRVPSTMLWTTMKHDLQVNTPFARLRLSAMFLLQLLVLLLLLGALGRPVVVDESAPTSDRLILMIDRSASMSVVDANDRSRLGAGKVRAIEIAERGVGRGVSVMVISVGRRPRLEIGFDRRSRVLRDVIESIESTDEEANLAAALGLAGSFSRGGGEQARDAAEVVFISDGGVAAAPAGELLTLDAGRFRFEPVGSFVSNTGIVSMSARRDLMDPARIAVFARVLSTSETPSTALVTLAIDGEDGPTRAIELEGVAQDEPPALASVSFEIERAESAFLTVRHHRADVLPADDVAAVRVPSARSPRVLLVHPESGPDPVLEGLLSEAGLGGLARSNARAFEQLVTDPRALARRFDLVVVDRVDGVDPGAIPVLSFGSAPPGFVAREPSAGGQAILSWDRGDPLMLHVSLDRVVYSGFDGFTIPAGASVLARGASGPVIVRDGDGPRTRIVVGFALARSSWAADVSVVIFIQNALDSLTGGRTATVTAEAVGAPVKLRPDPAAPRVTIRGPQELSFEVTSDSESIEVTSLERAGRFRVTGAEPAEISQSVVSSVESDVRPRAAIAVEDQAPSLGPDGARGRVPRPIGPWLLMAALAVLVLEWLWYTTLARA